MLPLGRRLDHHHAHPGQHRRGRVGPVRRLRDQAHVAVLLAARVVVCLDGQQAGELTLRPGIGLQRNPVVAGDRGQPVLQVADQLEVAGGLLGRGVRVDTGESGPADGFQLGGGIELHRAGAERDHRAVQREVLVGELAQEAQHRCFGAVPVKHRMGQVVRCPNHVVRQRERTGGGHGGCGTEDLEYAADHVVGGALVAGDTDVVGVDLAQVDPRVVGGRHDLLCAAGDPHHDGVEEPVVDDLAARSPQPGGQCDGVAMHPGCDGAQPFRTVVGGVHGGDIGQQRLRGADVAGRLVPADVLFAGLQREPVGGFAVHVDRHADQPAGQHALQPGPDRHVPGVRAAEEQRHTEPLRRAHRDVGALLARAATPASATAGRPRRW